jgi:arylsulfatase A-like enzyme
MRKQTTHKPTRRQVLGAGVATAALLATRGYVPRASASAIRRPNLLLLVTDDQRADTLSCSGNTVLQTPNIDALAQRGVRFRQSFSTSAICMSSRASILTGLYTRVHGVDDFSKPLSPECYAQSYPHLLHQSGYRTGFVGKWGIDAGEIPKQDFDYFQGYQGQGSYFEHSTGKHLTVRQTEQAIEFLQGCTSNQPFCLAVSFKAPHVQDEGRYLPGLYPKYPYDRAFEHRYETSVVPPVLTKDGAPWPEFFDRSLNRTREAPDFSQSTYQETMKDLYRLLTGVDQAVGQITKELKNLGFDDNTVILYTSDHGSFYGEHGFGGKWLMHEESIRTPMILCDPRFPRDRQGITCDEMVLNLDVPATLLELAGVPAPVAMQGRSLLSWTRSDSTPGRSEWFYEHHFRNAKSAPIVASEGIRTPTWKYIRYIDTDPLYEQMFDVEHDPREENNLAAVPAQADRLAHFRDRWNTWRAALDEFKPDRAWQDPPR